jgi:hypothetical protein
VSKRKKYVMSDVEMGRAFFSVTGLRDMGIYRVRDGLFFHKKTSSKKEMEKC